MLSALFAQTSYYTTSYYDSSTTSSTAGGGAFILLMMLFYLPFFVFAIIAIIGLWKTFVKAGKPGWASIVPVYNGMVMAEIAGKPSWWGLGMLVSPISLVLAILFGIAIAKRFGKSETFGVVALGLFPFVGYLMLGFGKNTYDPSATPTTV